MKKQPAIGQRRFGAPAKIDTGKLVAVRNLQSLSPSWKPDIFGMGEHFIALKPSKDVQLSTHDRIFFECIERLGPADGEEIWNEYYNTMKAEVGPKTFQKWMKKLISTGLVERIDGI